MSTYLWVEDFEGDRCQEYAFKIFGTILGIELEEFPDAPLALRNFLKRNGVILETNYSDASRFISNSTYLDLVDYIILDIDLALLGISSSEDEENLKPILEKWYGYSSDAENEEYVLNNSMSEMKRVAGYHLYIDLLINYRFPRKSIIFCSNHAEYLKSISLSFDGAKITAPKIYRKDDKELGPTLLELHEDDYTKLRRSIFSICNELISRLRYGEIAFVMSDMPGDGASNLTPKDGESLLGILPMLLPSVVGEGMDKTVIFRQFVRALTQDWDKVDYKDSRLQPHQKALASILVNSRNWTSHNSKALTRLTEPDVAFIFLLFLRSVFSFKPNIVEPFEMDLLDMLGIDIELDMNLVREGYRCSYAELDEMKRLLPIEFQSKFEDVRFFDFRVNYLAQHNTLPTTAFESFIYRMFWHQLHWSSDGLDFSPALRHFDRSVFIQQLSRRTFHRAFG